MKLMPIIALLGVAAASPQRRQLPIPQAKGKQTLQQPFKVPGSFDGGMKQYGRGVQCKPNQEGGDRDAVFLVPPGGTLSNVIIGPDQQEGIHCLGSCTLNNCWFQKVCEDAITIKGEGDAFINGGGAQGAVDKVIQHNGRSTVHVKDFTCIGFGKLYRSCGNCGKGQQGKRQLVLEGVKVANGQTLVGVNSNFGDIAIIKNTCASNVKEICITTAGTNGGGEAKKQSSGKNQNCQFEEIPGC